MNIEFNKNWRHSELKETRKNVSENDEKDELTRVLEKYSGEGSDLIAKAKKGGVFRIYVRAAFHVSKKDNRPHYTIAVDQIQGPTVTSHGDFHIYNEGQGKQYKGAFKGENPETCQPSTSGGNNDSGAEWHDAPGTGRNNKGKKTQSVKQQNSNKFWQSSSKGKSQNWRKK